MLFPKTILLVLFARLATTRAWTCDDCDNGCRNIFWRCTWDKFRCRWYSAPVHVATSAAVSLCKDEEQTPEDLKLIKDAKNRLIQVGYFTAGDFDGVEFKFCPLLGGGITINAGLALFNKDYRDSTVNDVASTMAHELFHISQIEELGIHRFACEYWRASDQGQKLGRGNELEDAAYEFEDLVNACLFDGEGCPN